MLEADVYAQERGNFVKLLQLAKVLNSSALGLMLLFEHSRYARRVTEKFTALITERMWQINQGTNDTPVPGEFLCVLQETGARPE